MSTVFDIKKFKKKNTVGHKNDVVLSF